MKMRTIISALFVLSALFTGAQNYTLNQCKDLAIKNNIKVKNKGLDVEASKEIKRAAFTKYFAEVKATALGYHFSDPLLKMDMKGGNLPVYDGNMANLASATNFAYFPDMSLSLLEKGNLGFVTATQPLYAGGRIKSGNKLASIGVEVSELQLKLIEKEILLETEKQYWQVISLYEKKKTLEHYRCLLDTLHRNVLIGVKAGMVTRNDLLKVELKQNELQMDYSKLNNGIELAKMAFCQYIGIDYTNGIKFEDKTAIDETPEQYYIDHLDALVNREEYTMLQKSTQAEKYKTKLQRGDYLPQAAIGVGAAYLDIMDDSGDGYGMVFGTINIPISKWWESKHKMKERRIREEQNKNMVNDTNEQLLLQMQQGLNTLNEAYTQIQLAQKSIRQSEENLMINQNHYKAGMVDVSDMLEAQAQLQESYDKYTEALTQYRIAKVNYLQVTGR
ncbi:TolC family protein [Puteibacter caeruleilacunae]|nr:TolC family protein [Puteibacter caeruleilacunae]